MGYLKKYPVWISSLRQARNLRGRPLRYSHQRHLVYETGTSTTPSLLLQDRYDVKIKLFSLSHACVVGVLMVMNGRWFVPSLRQNCLIWCFACLWQWTVPSILAGTVCVCPPPLRYSIVVRCASNSLYITPHLLICRGWIAGSEGRLPCQCGSLLQIWKGGSYTAIYSQAKKKWLAEFELAVSVLSDIAAFRFGIWVCSGVASR
jgi:hypothetical protein